MAIPRWIAVAGICRAQKPGKPGLWTHPASGARKVTAGVVRSSQSFTVHFLFRVRAADSPQPGSAAGYWQPSK